MSRFDTMQQSIHPCPKDITMENSVKLSKKTVNFFAQKVTFY